MKCKEKLRIAQIKVLRLKILMHKFQVPEAFFEMVKMKSTPPFIVVVSEMKMNLTKDKEIKNKEMFSKALIYITEYETTGHVGTQTEI